MRDASGASGKAMRRSQEERTADMRRRLIEATISLIVERGAAATSTRDVCARSGVSRGGLLHHFPNRCDLFVAATHWLAEQTLNSLDQQLRTVPHAPHLDIYLDWVWSTIDGPLFVVGLETLVVARTDDSLFKIVRAGADELAATLSAVVDRVVAATPAPDKQALRTLLLASIPMIRGVGLDLAIGGDRKRHAREFEAWRQAVRAVSGAGSEKRRSFAVAVSRRRSDTLES